jgi:hypothetical protein
MQWLKPLCTQATRPYCSVDTLWFEQGLGDQIIQLAAVLQIGPSAFSPDMIIAHPAIQDIIRALDLWPNAELLLDIGTASKTVSHVARAQYGNVLGLINLWAELVIDHGFSFETDATDAIRKQFIGTPRHHPETILRVGVAWSGNRNHTNDEARSIPDDVFHDALSRLYTLLEESHPGIELQVVNLNKDAALDADYLGSWAFNVGSDAGVLEILQQMDRCDVIFTVDTAAAHLAGLIGHERTYVLHGNPAEWRWTVLGLDKIGERDRLTEIDYTPWRKLKHTFGYVRRTAGELAEFMATDARNLLDGVIPF